MGFPMAALRLTLEASAFERRLVYKQAVGGPTHTLSAIVAGGAFSGDVLLLSLLKPIDEMLAQFTDIRTFVIADDIKVGAHGDAVEVGQYVAEAAGNLMENLEQQWGMRVSRDQGKEEGKTNGIASKKEVEERMRGKLKKNAGQDREGGQELGRRLHVTRS